MDLETLLDKLYNEPDLDKRRYIPDKLAKLGDWGSTHPLGKLITSDDQPDIMRNEAVESLGKQGDPEAIPYLVQVLDDEDDDIRRTAVWSLGQIGVEETLHPVFEMQNDPSVEVRRWVAKSAGRIRNDQVIAELQKYISDMPFTEERVIADIIRAVSSQHQRIAENDLTFWSEKGYELLKSDVRNYVKQAVMIMLNHFYSMGLSPDIGILLELFADLPEKDPLVRPLIIEAMGHANNREFLYSISNPAAIRALGIAGDTVKLQEILDIDPSDEEIIAVLEAYTHTDDTPDLDQYYDHSNLTIQTQALQLHAIRGYPLAKVREAYATDQGKFKILEILKYYGEQALDIFSITAVEDEKVARQTTVYSLISPEMIEISELHSKIEPILKSVNELDPIWHIRRDARIGLEYISKN